MKVKVLLTMVAYVNTTVDPKTYARSESIVPVKPQRVLIDYDSCTFLETGPTLELSNIHEHEGGADEETITVENANTRLYGANGIAPFYVSEKVIEIETQYFANLRKTVLWAAKG
jgi:hypothetical protein